MVEKHSLVSKCLQKSWVSGLEKHLEKWKKKKKKKSWEENNCRRMKPKTHSFWLTDKLCMVRRNSIGSGNKAGRGWREINFWKRKAVWVKIYSFAALELNTFFSCKKRSSRNLWSLRDLKCQKWDPKDMPQK